MKRLILSILFAASIVFVYAQQTRVDTKVLIARDSIILNGETVRISGATNDQVLTRVAGRWVNADNPALVANTVTDITLTGNGTVSTPLKVDTTEIMTISNANIHFVNKADSITDYVTPTQLRDSIQNFAKMIYKIEMPNAASVAGRIALTTPPSGWVLTEGASPVDLQVTHNLGRRVASVTVFSVTGTEQRQLFGNAAYSGIYTSNANTIVIESLATIRKAIVIYILFE